MSEAMQTGANTIVRNSLVAMAMGIAAVGIAVVEPNTLTAIGAAGGVGAILISLATLRNELGD